VQAEAVGQGVDLAAVDAVLAEVAATRVHAQLGRVVAHFLGRLDPDGTEPDPTEGRSLTLSKHADGSLSIHGELDAVGREKLCAVLDWKIPRCSAKGTTRRSTTGSGSNAPPTADGAPGVRTAPRSCSPNLC
jgi:Domain of unknown function (DUF222)